MKYRWNAYEIPASIEDALDILSKNGSNAKLIAGGTDLLVKLDQEDAKIQMLVDLTEIQDLSRVDEDENYWTIGAAVTLSELEHHPILSKLAPHLIDAIRTIGSVQIRNVATLGGNVTNASPAADGVLPLLTMDVKVVIASMECKREIPLASFFKGPGITQCGPKELVVALKIPKKRRSWHGAFEKLGARCSMTISIVNVAVNLDVVKGIVQDARVAIGAVAPTPLLVEQAAEALRGKPLNYSEMDRAAYFAEKASAPMSDLRGSASYRRKMVHSLTLKCLNRIKAKSELK